MRDIKPPYIAVGWMESFLDLVKRIKLVKIDRHILNQYDVVNLGNASKVVSALKFLNIIDEKGKIIENNINGLRFEGDSHNEELKRIIREAYKDLFDHINLENARKEDVVNYFIGCGYSHLVANNATKFFLYLAKKANFSLSDNLKEAEQVKKGRPAGVKSDKTNKKMIKKIIKRPNKIKLEDTNDDLIHIQIIGKGVNIDLTIESTEEIKPNLDIISQILSLNLKKKKIKNEETS